MPCLGQIVLVFFTESGHASQSALSIFWEKMSFLGYLFKLVLKLVRNASESLYQDAHKTGQDKSG